MRKNRKMLLVLSGVIALGLFLGGQLQARKMEFVAIATGGTGGLYYPLGGALAQIISNKVEGVSASAQSGNASVSNCNLLARGDVETAFVQNNVADEAYNGRGAWENRPLKNLRVIASLYPETVHIVARKAANINYLSDAKGKVVAVGDKGSGTEFDTRNILTYHKMTYEDITPLYVDYSVAAQRLMDNQGDVLFKTAGFPTSAIIELTMSTNCNFVSLKPEAVEALCKAHPFYVPMTIPANTYKDQTEPVQTIAMMALWATHAGVDNELVYKMTKALWDKTPLLYREKKDEESGAEILAKVHQQGKQVTLESALKGVTIPLHDGAAKYYKEVGLIK